MTTISLCIAQILQYHGVQPPCNIQQSAPATHPKSLPQKLNPTKKQLHPMQSVDLKKKKNSEKKKKIEQYTPLISIYI